MGQNKKIKCIVFDLDQTLVNHLKGELSGLKTIYNRFLQNIVRDFQNLHDDFTRINTTLWSNLKSGDYDAGFIINNRFKYLAKLYKIEAQAGLIQEVYTKQYINHSTPFGGARLLLDALYKIKIPMVIGSNGFIGCQTQKLTQHKLKKYFSKYYYGNKAPFCKPYQYFFQYIVNDIGMQADEILFVGDSVQDDIEPAIEAGMQGLHINQNYLDGENLAHEKIFSYIENLYI